MVVRPLRLFFGYTYPNYDVKILAPAIYADLI